MKNIFKSFVITFIAVFAIIACGGGGGSGGGGGTPAGMSAGTFTKTIGEGNGIGYSGLMSSIHTTSHWQSLYLTDDIGASGKITGILIQYQQNMLASVSCPGATIKLSHSNLSDLSTTFTSNLSTGQGGQVTVLSNTTITFPAGAVGTWHTINFTTPFDYNGVDNLIIDFNIASQPSGTVYDDETARAYIATVWTFDGSATGSVGSWLQDIQFKFAGGDNKVINTDMTGDNGLSIAPGKTGRTQMLILASDIKGSGSITGMAIKPDTETSAVNITGMTVKIAHLPAGTTALVNDFSANYGGVSPAIVTQNLAYDIPNGCSSAVWIPFNNDSFSYDGTSNLLIDISCTVSGSYIIDYKNIPTARTVSAADPDAATGTTRARGFEPVFRFYGGTMDVIGSYGGDGTAFTSSSGGNQFIVRAAELGSSGSIDKLAFRLATNSVASTYTNFSVTMAHSSQNALVAADATNIAGGSVVYNGAFSIPAGLKKGDWIEIPLSTPFNYNGESNLVIQATTTGGSADNWTQTSFNNTWFAGCYKTTGGGVPGNYRGNFKFWVNK